MEVVYFDCDKRMSKYYDIQFTSKYEHIILYFKLSIYFLNIVFIQFHSQCMKQYKYTIYSFNNSQTEFYPQCQKNNFGNVEHCRPGI